MSALPGGLFDGALPIGILMFLGTLAAFLRRKLGRKRAARRYPELARELGLEYTPPRYPGYAGVLAGV